MSRHTAVYMSVLGGDEVAGRSDLLQLSIYRTIKWWLIEVVVVIAALYAGVYM